MKPTTCTKSEKNYSFIKIVFKQQLRLVILLKTNKNDYLLEKKILNDSYKELGFNHICLSNSLFVSFHSLFK